ncbi:hypothetical protein SAMN05428988_3156 [Chitinophaga sp. YR573]|uniref:hypothetical protein n=1 Tax=Chitinophaga sp. YR573 TaxID=1881040 RepID=UPI0008C1B344|nr:hypothetical protein [Chitinophaga sp. YR573]SEW20973.1 hypothetical protein SAMN05428988_3156 [Chitinophaga sp. YR573]
MAKRKRHRKKKAPLMPAIPPEDYNGSIADWMCTLILWGYWDGEGWYGACKIPNDIWWELLEACEGTN